MHEVWSSMLSLQACDHGCTAILAAGHPVSNFMNDYYMSLILTDESGTDIGLTRSFEAYPEVWKDDNYRNILLDILIRIGTNMLISGTAPLRNAAIILVLEEYGKTRDIRFALTGRGSSSKRRLLATEISSHNRDALKFYRKRVSCKCLKRMHLEARKTIPKMAACYYCGVEKERVELSACSKCMVSDYCSKECQVAHWSVHQERCDNFVKAKVREQTENSNKAYPKTDEFKCKETD